MSELIDQFPMFDIQFKKFVDYGIILNCENFADNTFYYELLDEHKNQANLDKWFSNKNIFIDKDKRLSVSQLYAIYSRGSYYWTY
ncbi:hypothetical protein [Abyssogena phaseoliformis symbiont]|uniref:hypothetical protein n=1 Tax=Abyssogena phaseoliformis symbiont TaxID=596095 RepID=UPI0019151316|nr:hypothetical protein [Abyssogena phaseoliformis symbiont]